MSMASPQPKDESAQAATPKSCTVRRCLVTGEAKNISTLIRFVLDPTGQVTPDLVRRLPGRGLWVSADNALLSQAITNNLFSRAAKTKAVVQNQLLELVIQLLKSRCLELLGLARSAGATVTGMPQIEHGLRSDKLAVILLAEDAGKDKRKKFSRAVTVETGLLRGDLGAALGKEHITAVGMRSLPITQNLLTELVRWHGVKARQIV